MTSEQEVKRNKRMSSNNGFWSIVMGWNNVDWLFIGRKGNGLWTLRGFLRRY